VIDRRAVAAVVVVVDWTVVAAVASADQPATAGPGLVRAAGAESAKDGITSLTKQKLLK